MALAKKTEQLNDFDLEERIFNTTNFIFGCVSTHQETLELAAKWLNEATKPWQVAIIDVHNLAAEGDRGQKY